MREPLRIGLIGAGMVSRHHLIGWADIADRARVIAIADPSHDHAARRADEFGVSQMRLVEDCYRLSGREAAR